MKLSITTILYLPLVYLFLLQLNQEQPASYYEPIPFKFLVLYVLMFISFGLLLLTDAKKNKKNDYHWQRLAIVGVTILIIFGTGVFYQIVSRQQNDNFPLIHDGAQMTEVAGEMLWEGKNPYVEEFENTKFGIHNDWTEIYEQENPAWHHYIYLPFYLVTSAIFQKISLTLTGWYDLRFVFIIALILVLYLLYRLVPDREDKLTALLLFIFNPIFTFYFVAGYNDIFVFSLLLLSFYLLYTKKTKWSALTIGLAILSKQSAWLALPFYLVYLVLKEKDGKIMRKIISVLKKLWPLYLIVGIIALPFIIWAPANFISDTITYAGGGSKYIFPISGSGFSVLLVSSGIIEDMWQYFPFWIIQLIIGIPLMIFLMWWQKKRNTISRLILSFTIFLFVFWIFSRFFNPNYVSFISMMIIAAWVVSKKESEKEI